MAIQPDKTGAHSTGAPAAALSELAFLRRVLIVLGVGIACILLWRLRDVVLLLFAASLVSLFLTSLAAPVGRWTRMGSGLALGVVVLGLVLLVLLMAAFLGWRIQAQISEATDLLPQSYKVFLGWVGSNPLGARLLQSVQQLHLAAAAPALLRLPGYALSAVTVGGDVLLVIAGGVYLAAQPQLYRGGLLRLIPTAVREPLAPLLDETGGLLRKWLVAQLIAMVTVGLMVGIGMWAIGAPAPAALGLFAGLAEFVPIIGPVVSAVPALLLALLHGPDKAEWTLALFVGIQQFEGNLLLPIIERRIVTLPPVLTLFALVSFGVIFGPLGVFLATPLTVVLVVLVSRLYLKTSPSGPAPDRKDPQARGPGHE